ncbi:MAG TPA: hypothetical protein VGD80_05200 [Kofleriaceae bacterium]
MVVAILILARPVHADVSGHAGLNLRPDNGAHQIRVTAGLDAGAFDLSLTLDPMVITDGQLDTDVLATVKVTDSGWGIITGFRNTRIGILGGNEFQEKLIVGVGAPLPLLGDLPARLRWGLEAATVIVKHGADLPTDWISFAQGRDFVDLINFGMYVTFECCSETR